MKFLYNMGEGSRRVDIWVFFRCLITSSGVNLFVFNPLLKQELLLLSCEGDQISDIRHKPHDIRLVVRIFPRSKSIMILKLAL